MHENETKTPDAADEMFALTRASFREALNRALRVSDEVDDGSPKRMTQAEVAQRIDVDAETVSRFERGTVTPGLMTLERVCAVLGCTWTDVLEEASTEPEQVGPDIARSLAHPAHARRPEVPVRAGQNLGKKTE